VTEFGYETRPEDNLGVPYARQAQNIQQAMSIAAGYPFVDMFIWFVYRDDQGQPWDSGIYTTSGSPKGPSPAPTFTKRGCGRSSPAMKAAAPRAHATARRRVSRLQDEGTRLRP